MTTDNKKQKNNIIMKAMTTQQQLDAIFFSAQADIKDCWENPLRKTDRVTRNWIYAVDPETMGTAKYIWKNKMDGTASLYDAFVLILNAKKSVF